MMCPYVFIMFEEKMTLIHIVPLPCISNHCTGDAAPAYKNYRLSWKQEIASDHVELF